MFFFIGCNSNNYSSDEQIAKLYVDILIAEETYKTNPDFMNAAIDSLYEYYDISKDEYKQALTNYKSDEKTWGSFFTTAEKYLDTLKAIEKRKTL